MTNAMIKRILLLAAGLGLGLISPACEPDTDVGPKRPGPPSDDEAAYFERDFSRDDVLRATLSSTVLLQLENATEAPPHDTGVPGVDVVPYRLQSDQTLDVCLRDRDASVSDVTVRDDKNEVVLHVAHGSECASATLPAGDYTVSVARATTGDGATAPLVPVFLHPMSAQAPTALQAGPAVQCTDEERNTNPTSMPETHAWYVTTPTGVVSGAVERDPFVYVDPFTSEPPQDLRKFITVKNVGGLAQLRGGASGQVMTGGRKGDSTEDLLTFESSVNPDRHTTWTLLGNPRPFTFDPVAFQPSRPTVVWQNEGDIIFTRTYAERTPLTFAMRFVSDAASLGTLRAGEVAFFQNCDYSGKALVINAANAFPPNIRAATRFLGGTKSIKLSCNSVLNGYSGENYTGRKTVLTQNVRCGDNLPQTFVSASVQEIRTLVVETKSCHSCNLQGIDLRDARLPQLDISRGMMAGARLDRADLRDSFILFTDLTDTNFSYANLTRTNIAGEQFAAARNIAHRASFDHANLTGARLAFMDFSRAKFDDATLRDARLISSTFDGASFARTSFVGIGEITDAAITNTDLTSAYLDNVTFKLPPGQSLVADPCKEPRRDDLSLTKLAGTRFGLQQIPLASWRFIDFTDAQGDASAIGLDQRDLARKTLCGLKLGGLQFERWKLAEAKLNNADLARTTFRNTDLRYADLTGAVMNGASVVYSDLTNAKMDDVIADAGANVTTFNGTRFAPSSIVNGRFSRALFVRAAVTFPAPRTGSTFAAARFTDVNFTEADLTGLNMTGADFTTAVFHRATLKDTVFGPNSVFRDASFCGAKVEDANFNGAAREGALIPTADTTVANFITGQAAVPCVKVDLGSKASLDAAVITTNAATCPNGDTVPKGGSCSLSQFERSSPQPIVRCLLTKISDGAGLACSPCDVQNPCECDSKICTNGVCGPCAGK